MAWRLHTPAVASSGRSWFGRLWDRFFGRKRAPGPGNIPAAPHTLVARVSAVEEAREREMLRLAEESIRRGHPEQAAIVYRKAAERYRGEGKAQKELASLNLWAKVAPHDPEVWAALGQHHESADRTRPALEALARAAALWRQIERHEQADLLEARMADLRARAAGSRSQDVSRDVTPPEPEPEPPAMEASLPIAPSPLVVSSSDLDEDGPLELDMPDSGVHDAIEDEVPAPIPSGPRAPSLDLGHAALAVPEEDPPERLPTGALSALDEAPSLATSDLEDDEPEPLSASALEVVEEPPPIQDTETEPGMTYDRTVAMNAVQHPDLTPEAETDDEISPELMAELTRMAEDEATGEEGAATIAMPAIGAQAKRAFGIPDGSTVMDPNPQVAEDEPALPEVDDDYEDPDTRTRGYSADELAELKRMLDQKGRS